MFEDCKWGGRTNIIGPPSVHEQTSGGKIIVFFPQWCMKNDYILTN